MTSSIPPPSPTGLLRVLRHAALGTASAILFGAVLGALIGTFHWICGQLDPGNVFGWMLGGAVFGAIGGPVFGVVEALVIPAGTGRTGWLKCMALYGRVGGIVFGGVALVALGSAAPDMIIPQIAELLGCGIFGAVAGAIFGGIVGAFHALSARLEERVRKPVVRHSDLMDS